MKIAHLLPIFSAFGGGPWVVYMVATEQQENGDEVTIFALEADGTIPQNIPIVIMGMPRNPLWQRLYRLTMPLNIGKTLKWVPRLKDFDVIYSHHYPLNWLAYLAKKFYGVKFVYYNHGTINWGFFPGLVQKTYAGIFSLLANWTIKRADSAISVSHYIQQQLKEEAGLDSEVVYNKIDTTRFHEGLDGSRLRQKYNLGNRPLILFIGRIVPYKGLHLLLEAFNLVRSELPSANLVIVGKHILPAYSKKLAEIANSSVIFAGYVPTEELPYYYAACDIYATGTIWESFNIPLVEAQACGKPVVAFNFGPHPEVVKEGETGFLVPPRDVGALAEAVIRLVKNDKLRQEMGKNASKWVRGRFS